MAGVYTRRCRLPLTTYMRHYVRYDHTHPLARRLDPSLQSEGEITAGIIGYMKRHNPPAQLDPLDINRTIPDPKVVNCTTSRVAFHWHQFDEGMPFDYDFDRYAYRPHHRVATGVRPGLMVRKYRSSDTSNVQHIMDGMAQGEGPCLALFWATQYE